jgi:hypothetical protein
VSRQGVYSRIKEGAYGALIAGLRATKRAHLALLRALVNRLPASIQPYGHAYVDLVEIIDDILIGIVLAVVGIIVGFGEGVVGLVLGLVNLVTGVARGLYAAAVALLTGNSDKLAQWWEDLLYTLRAIPAGLRALVTNWLAEFEAAPIERQQLMIGELTGQILAVIASFYVAPSRAGSAGGLAAGGEAGAAATTRAGVAAVRPALTVIEGGGGAGGAARIVATEGNAARQLAKVAEVAPRPVPTLVPPPVVAPVVAPAVAPVAGPAVTAASRAGTARRVAAGVAAAARVAQKAGDEEPDERTPTMRHQIQRADDHYSSQAVVAANARIGVTGLELRRAMSANFERYMRIARREEEPPTGWVRGPVGWEDPIRGGIIRQSQLITQVIAGRGVTEAGDVNALRVCFHPRTHRQTDCDTDDVRLDVENQGHNLRQ